MRPFRQILYFNSRRHMSLLPLRKNKESLDKYNQDNRCHNLARPVYPYLNLITDLEKQCSPTDLSSQLVSYASNMALTHALMSGVSMACIVSSLSILTPSASMLCPCSPILADALFGSSFFLSLQGLMSSTAVVGHINFLPREVIPKWVQRYNSLIAMCGWLVVPSVAALGAGVVALADVSKGGDFASVALTLYILMGLASCATSGILIRGHVQLRRGFANSTAEKNTALRPASTPQDNANTQTEGVSDR
jgi:hypothetical protein